MVRVLLPTGQLDASVSELKPIKEMVIKLNGKKRLITENVETAFDEEVSGLRFGMRLCHIHSSTEPVRMRSQTGRKNLTGMRMTNKGVFNWKKVQFQLV